MFEKVLVAPMSRMAIFVGKTAAVVFRTDWPTFRTNSSKAMKAKL